MYFYFLQGSLEAFWLCDAFFFFYISLINHLVNLMRITTCHKILNFTFQYRSLAPMYYRGSAAAIVVYDVTREVGVSDWFSYKGGRWQ